MKFQHLLAAFIMVFYSGQAMSQPKQVELSNLERFCCYEWLPEFKDTFYIITNEERVKRDERYCVLTKLNRKNYDLYCWTGMVGLESPTQWRDRLRLKFEGNVVKVRFGHNKAEYVLVSLDEDEFLMIKKEGNKACIEQCTQRPCSLKRFAIARVPQ